MTILEAITRIDSTVPNVYSQAEKIRWLSTLDATIKAEIIDTHEGGEEIHFSEYTEGTPSDTVLMVPPPYDEVYLHYLNMQIDYYNREFTKYNNSADMYSTAYEAFWKFYNRTHMPRGSGFKFY